MRTANTYHALVGSIALAIAAVTASCSQPKQLQSSKNDQTDSSETVTATSSGARLRLDGKPDMVKIDMKVWYESGLRKYGINDFSTDSLISLMDSKIPSVRFFSASLLGERKERSAIPRLEESLGDKSIGVKIAAARALLQMGNRKGIKVMEDFCVKASKEFEQGNFRNTVDMSDALRVLAEAGEVSAIPYLRLLVGYDRSWGVRLTAVRSLRKLYEKEPAVLADIASALRDQHPQVRRETFEILRAVYDSYAEDKQKSK